MQAISGFWLVLLSISLTAVTVAVVVVARIRVWRASGPLPPDPADPPELDVFEVTYLNGGPALVATTAAVGLLRAGHLAGPEPPTGRRNPPEVQLRALAPPPDPHPVERAVYDLVAARPSRPFHETQRRVADTGAVATLRGRLQALGLVLSDREQAAYRRTLLWFLLPPVLAVALYGAGVLWTADAGLAAGLKVPPGTPTPGPEAGGGYEEVVSG
jgi:uncharacterized protein (TIGR04222 family)